MAVNLGHSHLGDNYAASVEAEFTSEFDVDAYTSEIEAEFLRPSQLCHTESGEDEDNNDDDGVSWDNDEEERHHEWKERSPNAYDYEFGDVYAVNWYLKFLHPSVREWMYYLSSHDWYGEFQSLFRMPLKKIDDLVSLYIESNWVRQTKHCKSEEEMFIKLELRILGVLKVLGHNAPFRTLKSDTNISDKKHRTFFTGFIHHMFSVRDDYIGYSETEEELAKIVDPYKRNHLQGCGGLVDVVHVKME